MGFTKALVVLWAVWLSTRVYGQPVGCTEDSQCPVGHYCEATTLYCQQCLSCDDYKRESPLQRDLCVKSVVQCGDCFEGLIEDLRMDRACSSLGLESGLGDRDERPTYVWAIIGLVVVALSLFVIVYVIFKKDTFFQCLLKIRATTSVHSTCFSANGAIPTAPELAPPPYDELYASRAAAPAASSAASSAPPMLASQAADEDASRPFIKRVPSARARGAREAAGSQAARPFNYPAYIRGPQTSYIQSDESEPVSPPFHPHDEDTMESHWTPNENTNNSNTNGNGVVLEGAAAGPLVPVAAAAARVRPSADEGPPAKTLCVREDTNNNSGRESNGAGDGAGAGAEAEAEAGATHAPTVVISVINNFNSFEQRNNLNLPRH